MKGVVKLELSGGGGGFMDSGGYNLGVVRNGGFLGSGPKGDKVL